MNERLKQLRKTLELSQAELGEKIGVSNFAISSIERGERKLTERNLALICERLNVNRDWLENGNGEMFLPDLPLDEFSAFLAEIDKGNDPDLREFLEIYRQLDEKSKKVIMDLGKSLLANISATPPK